MRTVSKFASWLLTLAPRAATADDMLDRFGPASPVGREFIGWCYEHYQKFEKYGIVRESFDVWKGLYKEATNLDDAARSAVARFATNMGISRPKAEEFLFAVETYMAVLMKLLIAEVSLQKGIIRSPSLRVLLGKNVVDGYRSLAQKATFLRTIFEEDIFDWFLEPTRESKEVHDQARMNVVDISDALDNLDFTSLRTDLIRNLYHGFFDPDTRRALGEFYTSDEIVGEILDFVGYGENEALRAVTDNAVLLDPSCGSGTFLVQAIVRLRKFMMKVRERPEDAANLLNNITRSIVGIDIHPFAVAMARANYILAIIDLLAPEVLSLVGEVSVPVYWTDSLVTREAIIPRIDKGLAYKPVEFEIPVLGKFTLPQPQDIDWDILATTVRRGLDNEWTAERFAEEFPEHQRLVYQEILKELYNWFVGRQKAGKDGRWISILTNASIVHKLREKCKFVVGNPPWVRIHNIDDTIRGRLRKKFAFYKMGWTPRLVKTQGRFKEQYDYCMAFVESGLRLLAPDGRLGFVITSKIMQALYAGSMRKTILEQYTILHLKDYSLSGVELFRDATNYPLILIVQKTLPKKILTSVEAVSLGRTKSWKTAQTDLPILKVDPMSPWMMVPPNTIEAIRKMQTRTYSTGFANNPRLGDVYNVVRGVMTSLNEVFLVKELTYSATAGLVVATTEGGQSVVVEEELLRPVVRGENISEDGFNPSGYIIWTHDDKTGEVLPQLPPNAKKHFLSSGIEAKLRKRDGYKKGMPAWIIFRVNKEKLRSKVAWQELDRRIEAIPLPASYKDPRLGKRVLIALQTVYFVAESNEANAAKLVVLLNSIPVRVFICSFAERARGGYFRHISWTVGLIPMPPGFDKIESESGKSSDPVSDAYGLDRDDIKALEEYYEFVYG